jgi:hypothetical protein
VASATPWIKEIWRVKKEDSAFVYFILESMEGVASYSTLLHHEGDRTRDIEIRVPAELRDEFLDVKASLQSYCEPM